MTEDFLAARLAHAMAAVPSPKGRKPKTANSTSWFVEFCCSRDSAIKNLAEEMGISYIGLSRDVCDLSNEHDMHQVMLWAIERKELGDVLHVFGSLPCTPWTSWQHLNKHILGETFQEGLEERRQESKVLVDNFASLTDVALQSGGVQQFRVASLVHCLD